MAITVEMRTQVSELYVALFGRAPDGEGLGFWVGELDSGKSLTDVANTMYATAPARAYYPAFLTNGEIIESFYQNVLGRAADAEGLAFWTAKLNAAGATPGSVINEMITVVAKSNPADLSAEGVVSQNLFNNKVAVAQWYGEQNGTIAGATAILAGVTDDAATVEAAKAGGVVTSGETFTLTNSADNIVGTAGNDKIGGTNSAAGVQFSAADTIDGGAGEDTLVLDLNANYNGGATIKNVEILQVTIDEGTGAAAAFDANGISGLTKIVRTAGDANGVAFNNVSSLAALEINNTASNTTVSYLETAVAGATDSVAVTLNNVTGGAQVNINSATGNTAGVETVAVTATGLASNVTLQSNDTSVSKVTVAGSSNLTLNVGTNVTTTATTIDATGYTGQLTLAGMGVANHTIVGGSGNDRFQFGANFTNADKVDGGDGVDTLSANGAQLAAITTKLADVKNIETLELANDVAAVATTVNAANFGSITNVRIADQGAAGAAAVTFNGLTAAAAGASNNIRFDGDVGGTGGAYTFNITGATDPATANAVTLDMRGAATTATSTINLAGVETITIDASNATGTQLFNLGAASLKTLTVKGIQAVDIDGVALGANVESVDASGLTAGAAGLNVALSNAAATGANVVGSALADRVVGSNLKDIINVGGGADTVVASGGQDAITLGAGADTFAITVAANVVGAAGANVVSLKDFVAGTDKIAFQHSTGAGNVLKGVTFDGAGDAFAAMADGLSNTTSVSSLADVYTQLTAQLTAGVLGGSAADGTGTVARVVTFTQGDAAGTYLVINDATAGFVAADDIVINITGVTGTVSAADFAFFA